MKYETLVILSEKTSEEEVKTFKKDAIEQIKNLMVVLEEGKRKLAYKVKGNEYGYFIDFIYQGEKENLFNNDKFFRANNNVIKFITIPYSDNEYIHLRG